MITTHQGQTSRAIRKLPLVSACSIAFMSAFTATGAMAQESGSMARGIIEEVTVTARKREESLFDVPVVVSTVGKEELLRRAITDLDGISRVVPQLLIGHQGGSVQGGNISMRGISGPDSNPFGDQAVSFNFDGVQVAKSTVRRFSMMDIEQVEVLKGPQALFFGKNSPGGILSLRTADPTHSFAAKLAMGYEFEAQQQTAEGFISAPISDTTGYRLAFYGSQMDGYHEDTTPGGLFLTPSGDGPAQDEFALRGTIKSDPSDRLSIRGKLSYGKVKQNGPTYATQLVSCPTGSPQSGSNDNCRADDKLVHAGYGPDQHLLNSNFRSDGQPVQELEQMLGSIEIDYDLTDSLILTSVTGLYWMDTVIATNYQNDYTVALPSTNTLENTELSQEFRITSNFDGRVNFTAGLYYSDTETETSSHTHLFAAETSAQGLFIAPGFPLAALPFRVPVQLNNYELGQDGKAYSAYAQLMYEPTESIEFTIGGRFTKEEKKLPFVYSTGNAFGLLFGGFPTPYNVPIDRSNPGHRIDPLSSSQSWTDFSPEVSISWKPADETLLFASYKEGFLSGGFNSSSTNFADGADISYDPQLIKGFEVGYKGALLDRALRLEAAAYTYEITDLQVTNFVNAEGNIRNAGEVEIQGVEFSATYHTAVDGLTLTAAAAYNDGEYADYAGAPCYNGQTAAQGCDLANASQDLGGTELIRAPDWNFNAGFNYETMVGSSLLLGLSLDAKYSDDFLTDPSSDPLGRMDSYTLVDASIRLSDQAEIWEVALISRNLTDEHYWVQTTNAPFTGGALGSGDLGDRYGAISRGREMLLRFTWNF